MVLSSSCTVQKITLVCLSGGPEACFRMGLFGLYYDSLIVHDILREDEGLG